MAYGVWRVASRVWRLGCGVWGVASGGTMWTEKGSFDPRMDARSDSYCTQSEPDQKQRGVKKRFWNVAPTFIVNVCSEATPAFWDFWVPASFCYSVLTCFVVAFGRTVQAGSSRPKSHLLARKPSAGSLVRRPYIMSLNSSHVAHTCGRTVNLLYTCVLSYLARGSIGYHTSLAAVLVIIPRSRQYWLSYLARGSIGYFCVVASLALGKTNVSLAPLCNCFV